MMTITIITTERVAMAIAITTTIILIAGIVLHFSCLIDDVYYLLILFCVFYPYSACNKLQPQLTAK